MRKHTTCKDAIRRIMRQYATTPGQPRTLSVSTPSRAYIDVAVIGCATSYTHDGREGDATYSLASAQTGFDRLFAAVKLSEICCVTERVTAAEVIGACYVLPGEEV